MTGLHGQWVVVSAGWYETYEDARNLAPGWDVYVLEREWRGWLAREEIEPKHASRHFLRFCQTWFQKRGRP